MSYIMARPANWKLNYLKNEKVAGRDQTGRVGGGTGVFAALWGALSWSRIEDGGRVHQGGAEFQAAIEVNGAAGPADGQWAVEAEQARLGVKVAIRQDQTQVDDSLRRIGRLHLHRLSLHLMCYSHPQYNNV